MGGPAPFGVIATPDRQHFPLLLGLQRLSPDTAAFYSWAAT
jgi:hypothetical protein